MLTAFIGSNGRGIACCAGVIGVVGRRGARPAAAFVNIAKATAAGQLSLYDLPNAKAFAAELDALGDVDAIDLVCAMPDGDPLECTAIYGLLNRHRAKITAIIDGHVGGGAALIPMAANRIVANPTATMRLQLSRGYCIGDNRAHKQTAAALRTIDDVCATAFARRAAGRHAATFLKLMDADTLLTADAAKAEGIVDSVLPHSRASDGYENWLARIAADGPRGHRPDVEAKLRQIRLDEIQYQ